MIRDEISKKFNAIKAANIDLSSMSITDAEIREICITLKELHPDLKNIYLASNKITDKGAIILANEFSALKHLKYLDLQFNQLDRSGIKAVLALKKSNPQINFALHGNLFADAGELIAIEKKLGIL